MMTPPTATQAAFALRLSNAMDKIQAKSETTALTATVNSMRMVLDTFMPKSRSESPPEICPNSCASTPFICSGEKRRMPCVTITVR